MVSENNGKQRPRGRPFPPGTSGNPHGRPGDYGAFRALCREKSPKAVRALVRALRNGDSSSVAAARVLLEYGWGKPSSAPEDLKALETSAGALAQLTKEQILAIAQLPDDKDTQ